MKPTLLIFLFFGIYSTPISSMDFSDPGVVKMYSKEYYPDGTIMAEGWEMNDVKTGYWKFYHPNGKLASQGHFRNNKKNKYWYYYNAKGELLKEGHYRNDSAEEWWIFYDTSSQGIDKVQYKNNARNGFGLRYNGRKLVKVEKYMNDKMIGEWSSVSDFKRDNPGITWR